MDIEHSLTRLGLTQGEVKVYLSLVKLGSSRVGEIIKKSGVSSSKVYIILDKLTDKGLISYIKEQNIKVFSANKLVSLSAYLEQKELELEESKRDLKGVIKELTLIQGNQEIEDEAKIYVGFEGLYTAYLQAIGEMSEEDTYLFFSTGYGDIPYLKRFFTKIVNGVRKKNIQIKGLGFIDEKPLYDEYYSKLGYQVKFTSFKWPADISILKDSVFFMVWKEKKPFVYEIKSKVMADSYRTFFSTIWDTVASE